MVLAHIIKRITFEFSFSHDHTNWLYIRDARNGWKHRIENIFRFEEEKQNTHTHTRNNSTQTQEETAFQLIENSQRAKKSTKNKTKHKRKKIYSKNSNSQSAMHHKTQITINTYSHKEL